LHLNGNKLKTLSGGDSEGVGWQNLHVLHLGDNPWTCDCNLQWMKALDLDRIDDENITYVYLLAPAPEPNRSLATWLAS